MSEPMDENLLEMKELYSHGSYIYSHFLELDFVLELKYFWRTCGHCIDV